MSEEFESFSEKYKRDHFRMVGNGKSLQDQLKEKEEIIEDYELQFKKLYEDFNYNVDLIFERDRDIESLNKKIEELSYLLSSKDQEIYELKQKNIRLKHLENENSMLIKKIESLTAGKPERLEKQEKKIPKIELKPPRLDYKNLLKDNKKAISKRIQDLSSSQAKNSFGYMESSIEDSETPFADLNFDLESRIKALEIENTAKEKKCSSLSISRLSDKTDDMDSDITGAREKVKKQEKEISELIKSLQTYKKQTELPSKMKIRTYDDQILALNEDIERLRNGENKLLSNPSESEENERKYIPIVRPRSTYIKRFN